MAMWFYVHSLTSLVTAVTAPHNACDFGMIWTTDVLGIMVMENR